MTQALIECVVKLVNDTKSQYSDPVSTVISILENILGYTRGKEFDTESVQHIMSRYQWD